VMLRASSALTLSITTATDTEAPTPTLLLAASALADANLVANPGFETGDFTGWNLLGNDTRSDHSFVSGPTSYPAWNEWLPRSGDHFAALGAVEFGKDEDDEVGRYLGAAKLVPLLASNAQRSEASGRGFRGTSRPSGKPGCFC